MTTSLQQLNEAIRLNNHAAMHINSGMFEIAISTLAAALKASRQILDNGAADRKEKDDIFTLDQCILSAQQDERRLSCNYQNQEDESDSGDVMYQRQQYKEGPTFLFRRAIEIPTSLDEANDYGSSVMISVIIIFNLALAHQQAGIVGDEICKAKLNKAAKLYELAYSLQREESMEGTALFTMATINNLGMIYDSLEETATAGKCFQHLLSTLMFMIDCGESKTISQFEGFFANTSHLIFPHNSAAAAA